MKFRETPVTMEGRTQTVEAWCRESGLRLDTVRARVRKGGWSLERALACELIPRDSRPRSNMRQWAEGKLERGSAPKGIRQVMRALEQESRCQCEDCTRQREAARQRMAAK